MPSRPLTAESKLVQFVSPHTVSVAFGRDTQSDWSFPTGVCAREVHDFIQINKKSALSQKVNGPDPTKQKGMLH